MAKLFSLFALALFACSSAAPRSTAPPPAAPAPAGTAEAEAPLPLLSTIKRGVLPNGLTYYVLPHGKPEKRGYLWLAVNAGSLQEDGDQRGLAHFVEHMAFNGTKRFPKQSIVNYVESIGVKFGPHLNAYTSFDETVYQLQVPTDDAAAVTKALDILRDWSTDVTFDPAEVDKERGVVLEEWRLGRGAGQRLIDALLPKLFGDWRYAARLPIGLPDILKKAPREALVRFYKDWYRPDLMAVLAVGDFPDPAALEKQIADTFGSIPRATSPRKPIAVGAPPAKATKLAIVSDRELPMSLVAVANLVDRRGLATKGDFRRRLAEQLYQAMLNERLQSVSRRPDAPFASAGLMVQTVVRGTDAFARFALVKNDDIDAALAGMVAEAARVERHGFTQSEFDRARVALTSDFERGAAEEATSDGITQIGELVRNFFVGELVIGAPAERDLAKQLLPTITLAEVGRVARTFGGDDNRIIVIAGPDGKPLPSEAHALEVVAKVSAAVGEPWKDVVVAAELMQPPAWPGTVASETKIAPIGVTEWKLANGVRVLIKPTDFERDHVELAGVSPGGLATAKDADYVHARFANSAVEIGGVGELDADALGKVLAGKQVSVSTDIDETTESIEGNSTVKDLETMLQLVHLRMTAPRRDERAFAVWKANTAEALTNLARSPEAEFGRQSRAALWRNHLRHVDAQASDVQRVDLDKAVGFYRDRFGDASDFTFVIAGAVDLATLRPLVEAYLGSLPGSRRVEKERDDGARRAAGVVRKTWKLGQDKDKALVKLVFHGGEKWTRDGERDAFILEQVASVRLREVLREDLSGVYGVGVDAELERPPHTDRVFTISFGCAPGAVDKLVDAAYAELAAIAKSGIGEEYLAKVKQGFVRERETAMRTNGFWIGWLTRAARYGDDPTLILDPAPLLARITSDRVKASAARFFDRKQAFRAELVPSGN